MMMIMMMIMMITMIIMIIIYSNSQTFIAKDQPYVDDDEQGDGFDYHDYHDDHLQHQLDKDQPYVDEEADDVLNCKDSSLLQLHVR